MGLPVSNLEIDCAIKNLVDKIGKDRHQRATYRGPIRQFMLQANIDTQHILCCFMKHTTCI